MTAPCRSTGSAAGGSTRRSARLDPVAVAGDAAGTEQPSARQVVAWTRCAATGAQDHLGRR